MIYKTKPVHCLIVSFIMIWGLSFVFMGLAFGEDLPEIKKILNQVLTVDSGFSRAHTELDLMDRTLSLTGVEFDAYEQLYSTFTTEFGEIPASPADGEAIIGYYLYDPWDNLYHYANPGVRNATGFDLWSIGPDGIFEFSSMSLSPPFLGHEPGENGHREQEVTARHDERDG